MAIFGLLSLFHLSYNLKIPDNILLIFQPPASPELNPIERFWQYLKHHLSGNLYENLDQLKATVRDILQEITPEVIISLFRLGLFISGFNCSLIFQNWYYNLC